MVLLDQLVSSSQHRNPASNHTMEAPIAIAVAAAKLELRLAFVALQIELYPLLRLEGQLEGMGEDPHVETNYPRSYYRVLNTMLCRSLVGEVPMQHTKITSVHDLPADQ